MKTSNQNGPAQTGWIGRTGQLACGAAAMVCGTAVLAGVLGLFGSASRMPWLTDTAQHHALLEPCGRKAATAERQRCTERVIEAVRHDRSDTRVAQAGGSPPGSAP